MWVALCIASSSLSQNIDLNISRLYYSLTQTTSPQHPARLGFASPDCGGGVDLLEFCGGLSSKKLLGAPGLTTRILALLGAPGIATRSILTTCSKKLLGWKETQFPCDPNRTLLRHLYVCISMLGMQVVWVCMYWMSLAHTAFEMFIGNRLIC